VAIQRDGEVATLDWATLLSALGGAVVGALASIAGSYMQAGQADKARRATAEEAAQTIQATAEEDEAELLSRSASTGGAWEAV